MKRPKRRLEETSASSATVVQGDDKAANAKAGHVPTSKSYSAVASQAAAQKAQASDASGNGETSQAQARQKPNEKNAELQAIREECMAAARAKQEVAASTAQSVSSASNDERDQWVARGIEKHRAQKPKEEDAELQAIKEGCLATARAKMAKQLAKQ